MVFKNSVMTTIKSASVIARSNRGLTGLRLDRWAKVEFMKVTPSSAESPSGNGHLFSDREKKSEFCSVKLSVIGGAGGRLSGCYLSKVLAELLTD